MPHMLYRSPWTRWFLAATGLTAGVIFALGDGYKWRSTPSIHWLTNAPIPLQAWGVVAIVYGLLLLNVRTRPVGYAIGAVLFAVFTVSLFATLGDGGPKNIFAIAGMLDVVAFHLYSIGIALTIKDAAAVRP